MKGHFHTNGVENFSSLLSPCVQGPYVALEPFHPFRYLDERSFRYNYRKTVDAERFGAALVGVKGKQLSYKALIGEGPDASVIKVGNKGENEFD